MTEQDEKNDPQAPAAGKLLTRKETATRLRVTTSTLAKWRNRGDGPQFVQLSSLVFYRQQDLEKFIDDGLSNLSGGIIATKATSRIRGERGRFQRNQDSSITSLNDIKRWYLSASQEEKEWCRKMNKHHWETTKEALSDYDISKLYPYIK